MHTAAAFGQLFLSAVFAVCLTAELVAVIKITVTFRNTKFAYHIVISYFTIKI